MTEVKYGLYKGRKYQVKFLGKTKHGDRAHLAFLDGSKDFWVDAKLVGEVPKEEAGQTTGPRPASEKQVAALKKILRQLSKVSQFDSSSGDGEEAAGAVRDKVEKLGGYDKLTSTQASELIQDALAYLDDEM